MSALVFFGVSLMTKPSSKINLAPFFKEEADELAHYEAKGINEADQSYSGFLKNLNEKITGERAHIQLNVRASENFGWQETIEKLKTTYPAWVTPTGLDSVYRLTHGDMLACVAITRGSREKDIWLKAEPTIDAIENQKKELFTAYQELNKIFSERGVKLSFY